MGSTPCVQNCLHSIIATVIALHTAGTTKYVYVYMYCTVFTAAWCTTECCSESDVAANYKKITDGIYYIRAPLSLKKRIALYVEKSAFKQQALLFAKRESHGHHVCHSCVWVCEKGGLLVVTDTLRFSRAVLHAWGLGWRSG